MADRIDTKETTMATYTAEDFANAEFARNPDGGIAARFDDDDAPWLSEDENWHSDATMADYGWVPVQEAADQPITLDALRDAWEGAEQAERAEPGDVLIWRDVTWGYLVRRTGSAHAIGPNARILHRAKPKRPEGAEQLEALLGEWGNLTRPKPLLADWLAERGVTVSKNAQE